VEKIRGHTTYDQGQDEFVALRGGTATTVLRVRRPMICEEPESEPSASMSDGVFERSCQGRQEASMKDALAPTYMCIILGSVGIIFFATKFGFATVMLNTSTPISAAAVSTSASSGSSRGS
jgi:hypothetical protein